LSGGKKQKEQEEREGGRYLTQHVAFLTVLYWLLARGNSTITDSKGPRRAGAPSLGEAADPTRQSPSYFYLSEREKRHPTRGFRGVRVERAFAEFLLTNFSIYVSFFPRVPECLSSQPETPGVEQDLDASLLVLSQWLSAGLAESPRIRCRVVLDFGGLPRGSTSCVKREQNQAVCIVASPTSPAF
jgi:hypothetical protein